MERKLIITRWKEQVLTSLLENGEIVEFHCSPNETKEQAVLGNIYVGKVKNIVPNIGAAFVEVAKGVECYYALDENETPIFTQKIGKKLLASVMNCLFKSQRRRSRQKYLRQRET